MPDIDLDGGRVRDASPSLDDRDYVTRDELEGVLNARNDARYLRRDGGNALTGDIPAGGHTLTGIRDAAAAQEPVSKAQLEAAVSGLAASIQNSVAALVRILVAPISEAVFVTTGGAWVVPPNVTRVRFQACGGGGGVYVGGGDTVITGSVSGVLATAGGGGAAIAIHGGVGGVGGGAAPYGTVGDNGMDGHWWMYVDGTRYSRAGSGGNSQYGVGRTDATAASGYGAGGCQPLSSSSGGGGGGSVDLFLPVVPGETLTVTVGGAGDWGATAGFARLWM